MNPFFSILSRSALSLFLLTNSAHADIQLGKYGKVYSGSDGVRVEVVDLDSTTQKQKLVRISGTDSEIDDVTLLHDEVPDGKGNALQTVVHDDLFWTIRSQDFRWGGKEIVLTLPEDFRKKYNLYFDEKETKALDKSTILSKYRDQLKSGAVRKVQLYMGDDWKAHTKRTLKEAVDSAKERCGAPLGTRLDWDSMKATVTKTIPVASWCRLPADLLTNWCNSESKTKSKASKLTGLTCTAGSAQNLSLDSSKRLLWTIPSSSEYVDVAKLSQQLKTLLK
ncbi:MAG: hypothetical protein KDD51_13165 [Bdellovibrionales bacterium]|nr:hypothetical protein [Bdellovibrionales bacterium]